jgi:hypothetical protein
MLAAVAYLTYRNYLEWRELIFEISLIKEGTTEKVLQFSNLIYNQKPGFHWTKNVFLNTNNKKSINWHNFCYENAFLMTYSEVPL